MNDIVKAILEVAKEVAVKAVPGGEIVDAAITAVVKHDKTPREVSGDLAEGTIKIIEAFKGVDIADEVGFRAGVVTIDAGVKLCQASVKKSA